MTLLKRISRPKQSSSNHGICLRNQTDERLHLAHLIRTYGEEFAEISVLPEAEYWRVVAERMQTQDTERERINELVPSEWAPTLAAARRFVRRTTASGG